MLTMLAIGSVIGLSTASLVTARLASGPAAHEAPVPPALAVDTLAVEPSAGYAMRRVFTGRVEANRTSGLGFERAGLLREVLVREGDPVKAGQVVARLDTALLQARRKELEAALNNAKAASSLAASTLRRFQESVDDGAVTRQALDESREGAQAAEAGVDLALARIESVDLDITKSELRAPFDGIVTDRLADEGRVLGAGTPVLSLQESTIPEVRIGVPGVLADTLRPGTEYDLSWRGRALTSRLRAVLPVRSSDTRTLDTIFVPDDPPAGLRAGELVEIQLSQWIEEPGLWLPLSALTEGARGLWQAYVAEPLTAGIPGEPVADHRVAPRPLEVLYQEGDQVFVRGSLGSGDRVVRSGLHRVVPGQRVRAWSTSPGETAPGGE
jgi:RND family efflux transporter MFP subunit